MPLLNSAEEWEAWKNEHTGSKKYGEDFNPYVYIDMWDDDHPRSFPCWLLSHFEFEDCQAERHECRFIYLDEKGQWDLPRYEEEAGLT